MKANNEWKAAALAKALLDITLFIGLAVFFGVILAIGVTGT